MDETLLELDDRRRASLGRIGNPEHRRYLVEVREDGTIILTPATVISDLEARIMRNASLLERIAANEADPARGVPRPRRG